MFFFESSLLELLKVLLLLLLMLLLLLRLRSISLTLGQQHLQMELLSTVCTFEKIKFNLLLNRNQDFGVTEFY